MEILQSVETCMKSACDNFEKLGYDKDDIKAIGLTNQRETTIVWNKVTGEPLFNAVVWLDARTAETVDKILKKTPGQNKDYIRSKCGLPISTYFSALKMRWLLDNNETIRREINNGNAVFGTVDSWLLYKLTKEHVHITDVTNASRTMLMNIHNLQWDDSLCSYFEVPKSSLPEIRSSAEIYGQIDSGPLAGKPIAGILGDQQAALVGQGCMSKGQAKNTYGTGCFLLYNTGEQAVSSEHGLLTTVAYKFGAEAPVYYALEGSIAIAGAAVQWLRDNLGIIESSRDVERLASSVESSAGCYFVPAFSGLFCPYWQAEARGIICGLTQYTTKAHIARACLESVCFQTRELLDAMKEDSELTNRKLRVDGGMTSNNLLMQLQADLSGIEVARPSMAETTALGAAIAAGTCLNIWKAGETNSATMETFKPLITDSERDTRFAKWKKAVQRSLNWEEKSNGTLGDSNLSAIPFGLFGLLSFAIVILSTLKDR
ncbi:DgyrCDS12484 [Dimorphilus gyrociliatus]|uniref:glycerol kinase n=1 Tax=Dimorphilus gyrociliatus TaxID=2664684 RepID=A0A7I8W8K9_9ANNE|nr:DgyrCDS12484 [Dimorphilus gyrociliatus]